MSNRRYHIHVICAANEQPLVLDRVAIFFQTRAFLTYDVSSALPRAALYGRQCIEESDYTVVVIGDSYGATHNTGVSQMHLSYFSAKAKLKPMLILIKTQQENTEVSPQLKEFIRLVKRQNIGIYEYTSTTDIDRLLIHAYEDMIERYPALSWVRENTVNASPSRANATLPTPPHTSSSSTIPSIKQVDSQPAVSEAFDSLNQSLNLTDTFEFQYGAQAYEGGNLTDVTMSLSCTWQEILSTLVKIPSAFSSYGLQSAINRLVTTRAEYGIKALMPKVHAVSRCQIIQNDLSKLQRLLIAANWIQLTNSSSRTSQELWKLTFYAKKIYEDSQSKTVSAL
ncbi:DUF4062 domain-containing protein [Psychrobacter frigidicola]|uniref:DUF4062 domain-containing protein n=1 Tax=Psychrobacter frigidicola TaxID=45611 RepID=A0A5C6ZZ21_9GAMM|nr:DUF4062 domain-containing protein [Psychrobacter frigidicola]TXD96078.1 DUF4062 domain-containing protein [Psychrobacter frigidicola]